MSRQGIGSRAPPGLRFDAPLAAGGYRWWRLDVASDDGAHRLALAVLLGSVFSRSYAAARRRGPVDPLDHCALHVAVYGTGAARWTLTERGRAEVARWPEALSIGVSAARWDGAALEFAIDEMTAPWPTRLRGTVRVLPEALTAHTVSLDGAGRHRWSPLAAGARVEVALASPALRWTGHGSLDCHAGDEPPDAVFASWTRTHAALRGGAATLLDLRRRDGTELGQALHVDAAGSVSAFDPPPRADLPPTRWRLSRAARADPGHPPPLLRTLADMPCHARSLLAATLLGESVTALHETLSFDRLRARWVQALLPLRAPRAWR